MSSEKFERAEEEFQTVYDDLRLKVGERIGRSVGEERKRLIREVERGFEDENVLLQEMEREAKMAPISYRTDMMGRLRNYRRNLDQLSRDLKRNTSGFGSRDDFGGRNELDAMAASQRAKLVQGTESLQRGTESIARSHRIAAETDQIAEDTVGELANQREALLRTRDRLVDTQQNLTKSRSILKSMGRRVMTNKMILVVIILVELAILAGVIYWKFFMKKKSS